MICPDCNGNGEAIYYEYLGTDFTKNTVNIKPKKDICRTCNGSGHTTQTNADRIRAMSDEELAVFLADEIPHGDCYGCDLVCYHIDKGRFEHSCQNAWYGWIKQPVKENDNGE